MKKEYVCKWCGYRVNKKELPKFVQHLRQRHYKETINHLMRHNEKYTKQKAVNHFGEKQISFIPEKCPYCHYKPPKETASYSLKKHISEEHWTRFIEETKKEPRNPLFEIAVDEYLKTNKTE